MNDPHLALALKYGPEAIALLSSAFGIKGLLGGSKYEDQARLAGANAASLERKMTGSITRRLAGTPSVAAQELARQAESGVIRQTQTLQQNLERSAKQRGIYGSGIGVAQQRRAGERGIRAATATRRGVELADIKGAETDAANLANVLRVQERQLRAQDALEQQPYGQLLGYGAQVLQRLATGRSLRASATEAGGDVAAAAAPAAPNRRTALQELLFPSGGIFGPPPQVPEHQLSYPGLTSAPDYSARFWANRALPQRRPLDFPGLESPFMFGFGNPIHRMRTRTTNPEHAPYDYFRR